MGAGEGDLFLSCLCLLRRIRSGARIEQRQGGHPLRRLAHDLEGDVPAHRQAEQSKALRRVGQDRRGDARHAVRLAMVRYHHRAQPPQGRQLLGKEARRCHQAGDQQGRDGFGH